MINSVHLQYQSYWKISYNCVCVAQMKCDQQQLLSLHVANGNNKTVSQIVLISFSLPLFSIGQWG